MSDIVERLRAPAYWMSGSDEGHEGENDAPLEAADEIERLRAALESVMVGGNHLATIIGATHPQVGTHYEAALQFYGPGHQYDAWCCWNAIMEARAAIDTQPKEKNDE